jgi:peptidoglycan hydrolase-like protein with peptidoglycan-binding domain
MAFEVSAETATVNTKRPAVKKTVHSATRHSTKGPAAKASNTKAGATKGATTKSGATASHKSSASSRVQKSRRVTRSYQQQPTPQRYQEIQQALTAKGYFQGEANGQWGPESVDSLKRFQADQNLAPDGKVGALSLIALGLGPKRLAAQTSPQPPVDAAK